MCVVGVAACAVVEISVATTASGYHVTELMLSTSASVVTALERISRTQLAHDIDDDSHSPSFAACRVSL